MPNSEISYPSVAELRPHPTPHVQAHAGETCFLLLYKVKNAALRGSVFSMLIVSQCFPQWR